MIPITFVKGDATRPQTSGAKIIAHVCNDLGRWGKGFVVAVSGRWLEPERAYRTWSNDKDAFRLGAVQFIQVGEELWVANMVAQHGLRRVGKEPPIRYAVVEECLVAVAEKAKELGASVHMPRIGCGLAGGKWDRIEPLIAKTLCEHNIPVVVCDF